MSKNAPEESKSENASPPARGGGQDAASEAAKRRGADMPSTSKKSEDQEESMFEELVEAATKVENTCEASAVLHAVGHTPDLAESGIAPEVLAALFPGDKTVVLPRVSRVAGGFVYRAFKRSFDVIACLLALAILALPMILIAFKIRLESPGPTIYVQKRVGKDGRVFKLYKFRSMRADAEADGARWASGDDPRVTPFGRLLRRTRLDEVPQFWNVVKGDMSLIGPRPERPAFHEEFCKRIDGWDQRLLVKPGITGLAQVVGGYNLLPGEKILFDIEYIKSRNIVMDVSIVLKTLRTVITGEGAR